jgi:hypothetical protein
MFIGMFGDGKTIRPTAATDRGTYVVDAGVQTGWDIQRDSALDRGCLLYRRTHDQICNIEFTVECLNPDLTF